MVSDMLQMYSCLSLIDELDRRWSLRFELLRLHLDWRESKRETMESGFSERKGKRNKESRPWMSSREVLSMQ